VLSVIADRNDTLQQDAGWLHRACVHRRVHVGEEVIHPGVTPTHLLVVLDGEFEVLPPPGRKIHARRLGPGALLWKVPCARCSVRAATNGTLLCIRPCDVDARMREDPSFGGRFLELVTDVAVQHNRGLRARSGKGWLPAGTGMASREPELSPFQVSEVIEKLLQGDF